VIGIPLPFPPTQNRQNPLNDRHRKAPSLFLLNDPQRNQSELLLPGPTTFEAVSSSLPPFPLQLSIAKGDDRSAAPLPENRHRSQRTPFFFLPPIGIRTRIIGIFPPRSRLTGRNAQTRFPLLLFIYISMDLGKPYEEQSFLQIYWLKDMRITTVSAGTPFSPPPV